MRLTRGSNSEVPNYNRHYIYKKALRRTAELLVCVRTFHPNNKQLRVYMAQNSPNSVCPKPRPFIVVLQNY